MPSARMSPDGELSFEADFTKNTEHYDLGFQALPWLETSFRYSGLMHFNPEYPVYWDRSFAIKARFWNESDWLPAMAVGINDMVGTGIYSSEYLVASKQFGPFDATLGMGWGRLGTAASFENPLGYISSSFLRQRDLPDIAGATNFSSLFHGPKAGLFGGINWYTPVDGLVFSAEYSGDSYADEAYQGNFKPHNQLNVGVQYAFTNNATLGIDWLYGNSIGGNLSFQVNPIGDPFPQRIGAPLPDVHVRTYDEQQHSLQSIARARTSASSINVAGLVDSLWDISGPVDELTVRGSLLSMRVKRDDVNRICKSVASQLRSSHISLSTVVISYRRKSVTCRIRNDEPTKKDAIKDSHEQISDNYQYVRNLVMVDPGTYLATASNSSAIATIRAAMRSQRLDLEALELTADTATVYYYNTKYFHEAEALKRIVRILMADAPASIEHFRLISTNAGVPQRVFDFYRGALERTFSQTGDLDLDTAIKQSSAAPMDNPALARATTGNFPHFAWSVYPQMRQELFDPSNPFAVQFLGAGDVSLELLPGLALNAEGEINLYDNFNTLRASDSSLPHVRTDFVKFFTQGKNGIGDLEASYFFRLSPEVFALTRIGYLESMYGGAGGEILWKPDNQRWALGGDGYEVQERNFDRLLGYQSYRAFTGHVSLYYASPWYGLNFVIRAGQYLAKDRGITFEMTRQFDSGVEIGAFFTKTNVSAQEFGEGSFDKGIMIRIPLSWAAPMDTQSQFNMDLRPVQRDGGQRLLGDATLFDRTRRASPFEMERGENDNQ